MLARPQRQRCECTKVIEDHGASALQFEAQIARTRSQQYGSAPPWPREARMTQDCELPNLRHLRVFQTVARLGSISGASREARLSQPAVTQGIAKLEALLDVVLFERRQSGCFLTEYGRTYLARTNRMLSEMEEALVAPLVGPPVADDKSLR